MARQSDIRLRRSAISGAIPATSALNLGELALNTYDGKLYMKKDVGGTETIVEIGGGGTSQDAVWREYTYTVTTGRTSFSGPDDNSNTLAYSTGYIQVFFNGVLLDSTDYTATTSSSVVLDSAAVAGDIITISAFSKVLGTGDIVIQQFTGNGSTAAFTLSDNPGNENNTRVFIDGVYQNKNTYSVSGTTLTLTEAPANSQIIEVEIGSRNVTIDDVNGLNITGNLVVGSTITATGGNSTNWNTAYGWGDHASAGYTTTDTTYSAGTGITLTGTTFSLTDTAAKWTQDNTKIANWDTAYGWGDHASVGYTTTDTTYSAGTGVTLTGTTFSLTDTAAKWTQDNTKISNWDTAFGWGDHSIEGYATETYVGTQISNLVDASPATLDTLNELAAALGDDPNFATTVSTSIGTKWTQDNTKIANWDTAYGWGNHATAGYAASSHVHSYLPLAGGTLSGSLSLGTNDITSVGTITATQFSGGLLGDVTGNVLGNVTGDVSGSSGTVLSLGGHTTTDLTEGTNLYFTDERVDDRVAALLVAGTNITLSYNDAAGTLTVNSSGKTQEEIEDIVGGLLVAGTGIGLVYNDAGGALTVTNTAVGANAFGNIAISGQSTVAADSTNDTLTLVGGTGITLVTDAGTDTITITNSSLGANAFGNITVSGQATIAADSTGDTLTLAAGAGMIITTTAGTDTITISGNAAVAPFVTELYVATGGQTTFALTNTPQSEDSMMVFIDGVYQNKNSYVLTGSSLVFDSAVPINSEVVFHIVQAAVNGTGNNLDTFTGDNTTTDFTLTIDPISENNVWVFLDGVYQEKSEFSVSGTTLSFVTAPASGDSVEVITPTITAVNAPSIDSINSVTMFNESNIVPNVVTTTTFGTTSATSIASHSASTYRTVKYLVQCTQGTDYHSTEINLIHDGTTVYLTEYGSLWDNASLGTFDATISGGNILLQMTAGSASSMTTKVISTAVPV